MVKEYFYKGDVLCFGLLSSNVRKNKLCTQH